MKLHQNTKIRVCTQLGIPGLDMDVQVSVLDPDPIQQGDFFSPGKVKRQMKIIIYLFIFSPFYSLKVRKNKFILRMI